LKFFEGGYVPSVLALVIFMIMRTWKRGRELLGRHYARASRPLTELTRALHDGTWRGPDGREISSVRVSGVAVFMTSTADGTPPLLLHHLAHVRALHERVILVTITTLRTPRVIENRFDFADVDEGISRLNVRVGYMERPDVPRAIEAAIAQYGLPLNPGDITYFLGRETLLAMTGGEMGRREEALFAFLNRNSQNATRAFGIPPARVIEIGVQLDL
jgi:KUP system potassium uptake protein